ncbi:MAG: tetratricopeptide repeat protein, partial [Ruminococcus sp.]|nr:tetratricopeptide repeat protein [Ruminococcus sp.]
MPFTPTVTKDLGTALDIILTLFGLPAVCKNVSTCVALIQQVFSKGSSPDNELKELSEKIAKAIGTVLKHEISEDARRSVLSAVKSSLEKFKQNAESDGKDIKNIFADNINSPEKLIEQICERHNGLDGEAEDCYKSIIHMTVTALCKAENVELFINQNYALVKLMLDDDKIKKLLEDTSSKIDDIKAMLVGLIKERCLTESELPTRSTTYSFSYLNENIELQGRETEQKRIEEFMLAENPFTFWSVTGKGGTGKSKFALHIAKEYIKRGWVVIWCESTTDYDNIFRKEFIHPTLFIFDYAGFSTKKIQKVLHRGSKKSEKQKIRLLFVERDKYDGNGNENWYSKIFNNAECLKYKDHAYYSESLNLGPLDDNSIKILLNKFAEERAKELKIPKNTFSDNEKQRIIDYVRKTLPRKSENLDFADRCLFILFTADACLRGKNYSDWDAETLLSSYITQYISKLSETTQLKSHLNLLAIATATGGVDVDNDVDVPVLSTYIEKFINDFECEDDISQGQEFIRCLCEKEQSDSIITPMYPDLVGEYFFISRINNIPKSVAKDWVSIFHNKKYKEYFITFLERTLEDWDLQGRLNDVKDWFIERLQSNPDDKLYSAYLLSTLARIYYSKGNYGLAVKYYEKSKDIFEEILPENHSDLASIYNNLGNAYSDKGDIDTAIEYYEKALKIREELLLENHPDLAMSYNNLGIAYDDKGALDKAIEYHNKALKEVLPENHPDLAGSYNNLGGAYNQKGDYDKAIEHYHKALKIYEEVLPENHPDLASTYNNLGTAYSDKGDFDKAIEYHNKALKIYEEVLPENHPDLAMSYNNLGNAYDDKGDIDTAIEYYDKSLKIREEVLPENH